MSLAEAGVLRDVPTGFDLAGQLQQYRPEAVVGDGDRVFVIARDASLASQVELL